MSDFSVSQIMPSDTYGMKQVNDLLQQEGIRLDGNLDYTCGIYDEDYNVIATGSCFGNTLRCFAVSSAHQGEGLLNEVISHLIQYQAERGNFHLFLYTKVSSALFFGDLGFKEIARVQGTLVFMENRSNGFKSYLESLKRDTLTQKPDFSPEGKKIGAIVMNANPFTLGHQYLAEKAAAACDLLHIFVVSEDASLVPFSVRRKLVREGTAHLPNIVYHDSGPYIISSATFPSYFLKDEAAVIDGHARLDLAVFTRIAEALSINCRFVGEEPASQVTGIYNQIMVSSLPAEGIECVVIPRKAEEGTDGKPISASTVRVLISRGDWDTLSRLVPETTLSYFKSEAAEPVLKKIRAAADLVHY